MDKESLPKAKRDIQIAFFDVDGTLVDMDSKKITPAVLKTLQDMQKNGIRMVMATGRGPTAIPHFDGFDFDAYITYNGAYCFQGDHEIYKLPIPAEDVRKLVENCAAINRPVAIASANWVKTNGADQDLRDYFWISKQTPKIADDFDEACKQDIYQMMSGGYEDEYEQILKDVDGARITAWWDRALDIVPASVSKGTAVEKVLDYFGLQKEQSIAFGDGENDVELLKAAGHGIAMANANPVLKEAADEICRSVKEDGVADWWQKNRPC